MRGAILVMLLAVACFRYQPTSLTPAAGTHVRLVLKTPTAVAIAATAEAERREVASVLEASGTTIAVAADTLSLRLGELRTVGGRVADVENAIVLVPVPSIASVNEKRLDTGQTLLGGAALVMVSAGAAMLALIAVLVKAAR